MSLEEREGGWGKTRGLGSHTLSLSEETQTNSKKQLPDEMNLKRKKKGGEAGPCHAMKVSFL